MNLEIRPMTPDMLEEMMDERRRLNPDLPIRDDIKSALDRYAYHGLHLGSFLSAVVENNLVEALGRADSYNRASIFQITQYIYNELPASCWGSPEKVRSHYASFSEGA